MVEAGKNCQRLPETAIHRIRVEDVQADGNFWGFVGCKEKMRCGSDVAKSAAMCVVVLSAIERGEQDGSGVASRQ